MAEAYSGDQAIGEGSAPSIHRQAELTRRPRDLPWLPAVTLQGGSVIEQPEHPLSSSVHLPYRSASSHCPQNIFTAAPRRTLTPFFLWGRSSEKDFSRPRCLGSVTSTQPPHLPSPGLSVRKGTAALTKSGFMQVNLEVTCLREAGPVPPTSFAQQLSTHNPRGTPAWGSAERSESRSCQAAKRSPKTHAEPPPPGTSQCRELKRFSRMSPAPSRSSSHERGL